MSIAPTTTCLKSHTKSDQYFCSNKTSIEQKNVRKYKSSQWMKFISRAIYVFLIVNHYWIMGKLWNLQSAGGYRNFWNAYMWMYRLCVKVFAAVRIINRWPRCTGQKAPEPTSTTGVLPSSRPFLLQRNLKSARHPSMQLISDWSTSGGVGGLLVGVERDSELPIVLFKNNKRVVRCRKAGPVNDLLACLLSFPSFPRPFWFPVFHKLPKQPGGGSSSPLRWRALHLKQQECTAAVHGFLEAALSPLFLKS